MSIVVDIVSMVTVIVIVTMTFKVVVGMKR